MKILIKQAIILDSKSTFNGKKVDVMIQNGIITSIDSEINNQDAKIIQGDNLHISQGWVDLKASFCDPGEEHKETIETGLL